MPPHFNKTLKKIDSVFSYQSTCLHAKDALIDDYDITSQLFSRANENKFLGIFTKKDIVSIDMKKFNLHKPKINKLAEVII